MILMEASEPGLAASLMKQGHHVLIAHGSQVGTSALLNSLSRPDPEVFKDALVDMGFRRIELPYSPVTLHGS